MRKQRVSRATAYRRLHAPKKRMLSPGQNQPQHDVVETPQALAATILQHFTPKGRVLDPCRGQGHAFYKAMVAMSLDASWCEITEGRDFYDWKEPVHWIISNPPWSKIRPFLRHAMSVADNVVFLVTLTHLDTRARDREIEAAGFGRKEALIVPNPPPPWPASGFMLVAYHLQRGWRGGLTFNRAA
jgi:hypothetical protein